MAPTISSLLSSAEGGDRSAADALFAALYAELHALARRQLARGPGFTLGTTTLLHEAYLNISGREGARFPDRARFMGYAAKVMRGLVIDYARSHQALKRGGGFELTVHERGGRSARPPTPRSSSSSARRSKSCPRSSLPSRSSWI